MSMNYLQLFQRTHQESGTSGSQPTAVLNQTGKLLRIVNWVQQAWVDIQNERPNWEFMWKEFTFDTVADQRDYLATTLATPITDLKHWNVGTFLMYEDAIGASDQNELEYFTWKNWRYSYRNQMEARASDRPQLFTVTPDNKVRFESVPDKVYNIAGEYSVLAQVLAADTDIPILPDDYHMIIVWQALKYYGFFEDAPDVLDMAETNFENMLVKLEDNQLPEFDEDFQGLA
jgi:hypothetical protein